MFNYNPEELLNLNLNNLTFYEDIGFNDEVYDRAFKSGIDLYKIEKRIITKTGNIVWINENTSIIKNQEGIPEFRISIIEDLTEKRAANEEIERFIEDSQISRQLLEDTTWELYRKNEALEESEIILQQINATKDKFFSIIAHDLKNPVNAFRMLSALLCDEYDNLENNEKIEFLGLLKESSESLCKLLENLLTWSRSQQGVISYYPEEYNLYQIVFETFQSLSINAEKKNIELINEVPEETNLVIDTNMIRTVIQNLVSNSIKFTVSGGKVSVSFIDDNSENIIIIKDTGVGIPPEIIPNMFKIEHSKSTLGTSKEKGTGLGLILCKEFIDKHNGRIEIESQLGIGSIFKIYIPKKILNSDICD